MCGKTSSKVMKKNEVHEKGSTKGENLGIKQGKEKVASGERDKM